MAVPPGSTSNMSTLSMTSLILVLSESEVDGRSTEALYANPTTAGGPGGDEKGWACLKPALCREGPGWNARRGRPATEPRAAWLGLPTLLGQRPRGNPPQTRVLS